MSRKIIVFIILILLAMIVFISGCSDNEINLYFGASENIKDNTKLEIGIPVIIKQNKERIENSKLVFYKNNDGNFENMYLCFSGSNISSVSVKSENKTILYDDYNYISRPLDVLTFYYEPGEIKESDNFDAELDLELRWDKGEFDNIKNVYLNGLSINEIKRFRRNSDKQIGYVNTNLYTESELKNLNNELYYLNEKHKVRNTVVFTQIDLASGNSKKSVEDEDDIIIQDEFVSSNINAQKGTYIYLYEMLFYNSQQMTLQNKTNFNYADLSGETCYITVNYLDDTVQKFSLEIDFDNKGNIIAMLR